MFAKVNAIGDLFRSPYDRLRALIRARRFPVWLLVGIARQGSHELRLLYGGQEADKFYVLERAFNSAPQERYLGKKWIWAMLPLARRYQCDVDIVSTVKQAVVPEDGCERFRIPAWLTTEVIISAQKLENSNSKSRRRDIRQIRKNGFCYEITSQQSDLNHFYYRMYLPMMRSSHGEGALLMKYDRMLQKVRLQQCELLMISRNQRQVAGSLIVYDEPSARLWSEGILDADRSLLRLGVGAAIYLFSFQHLLQKGYQRVNIGRSRAFLNDGVLYYKKRLRPEITAHSDQGLMLRIHRPSPAAHSFLLANPFVFHDGDGISAAIFAEAKDLLDDSSWESIWQGNHMPGISRVVVYALGKAHELEQLHVPDAKLGHMELRTAPVCLVAQTACGE